MDLSVASTDFALNLLRKLSEGKDGENAFFSPASISVALAMTYAGADAFITGSTATFRMPSSG